MLPSIILTNTHACCWYPCCCLSRLIMPEEGTCEAALERKTVRSSIQGWRPVCSCMWPRSYKQLYHDKPCVCRHDGPGGVQDAVHACAQPQSWGVPGIGAEPHGPVSRPPWTGSALQRLLPQVLQVFLVLYRFPSNGRGSCKWVPGSPPPLLRGCEFAADSANRGAVGSIHDSSAMGSLAEEITMR
jgi:hypothetical protein